MRMFYFFRKDEKGKRTFGEEFFVMARSYDAAVEAVINSKDWKDNQWVSMDKMGWISVEENFVIQTELC